MANGRKEAEPVSHPLPDDASRRKLQETTAPSPRRHGWRKFFVLLVLAAATLAALGVFGPRGLTQVASGARSAAVLARHAARYISHTDHQLVAWATVREHVWWSHGIVLERRISSWFRPL